MSPVKLTTVMYFDRNVPAWMAVILNWRLCVNYY